MFGSGKRSNGHSASGRGAPGAGPPEQGVNSKVQQPVLPQHHNNQQQQLPQQGEHSHVVSSYLRATIELLLGLDWLLFA